jgi:hypothetical protein
MITRLMWDCSTHIAWYHWISDRGTLALRTAVMQFVGFCKSTESWTGCVPDFATIETLLIPKILDSVHRLIAHTERLLFNAAMQLPT